MATAKQKHVGRNERSAVTAEKQVGRNERSAVTAEKNTPTTACLGDLGCLGSQVQRIPWVRNSADWPARSVRLRGFGIGSLLY